MDMLDFLIAIGWIWAAWTGARRGVLVSVIKVIGVSIAYCVAFEWHGAIEAMLPDFVSPPASSALGLDLTSGTDSHQMELQANMFFGGLSFLLVFLFVMLWVHVVMRVLAEGPWHFPAPPSTWRRRLTGTGVGLIGTLMSTCVLLNALQMFPGQGVTHEIHKAPVSQWILSQTVVVRNHLLQVDLLNSSTL